jgi:hypothetical protein
MRSIAARLSQMLTLAVGISSLGCLERYAVPRAAFEQAREIDRDWRKYVRPAAVSARRRATGEALFVRAADLVADGPALGGLQRAHTTNIAPAMGGALMAIGTGFAVGAIVLVARPRSFDGTSTSSAAPCFAPSGGDDQLRAIVFGALAPLAFLSGLGILAATASPHHFEVGPGHKELIYVGADGALHF